MKYFFLILLISAAASAAEVFSEDKILSVSQSRYWQLLLHYRNGKSEADGSGFFLSSTGRNDPAAELRADILAFSKDEFIPVGNLKQHPQCAFPERFRYLKSKFDFSFKIQVCNAFNEWKNRFNPQSVTLVYAAPYLGSPASMFGHSFLRIDSAPRLGQKIKNDLLDYGISFEAITGGDPGPTYAFKGLTGFYEGVFSQSPYFQKINTYINMESRDLWEYQINLTPEQIGRMLSHLWETGTTYFNYYFFNKNCSYQLLSLLEVANPDWELRSQFGPMAIPIDTVKAVLKTPNAVSKIYRHPSLLRDIKTRLSNLTSVDLEKFYLKKDNVSLASSKDSLPLLDALIDWQKFNAMSDSLTSDEAEKKIDDHLLILRSKIPNPEIQKIQLEELDTKRPDEGHPSTKVTFISGTESGLGTFGFELRSAFHDVLDLDEGYLPLSSLIISRLRLSYLNKIRLEKFEFAGVTNIEPLTRLEKPVSWTISTGLTRPVDTGCVDCIAGYLQGGGGYNLKVFDFFSITAFLTGHAELFNQWYRFGPGIQVMGHFSLGDKIKLLGGYEYIRYFLNNQFSSLGITQGALSYTLLPLEFRLQADFYNSPGFSNNLITLSTGYFF